MTNGAKPKTLTRAAIVASIKAELGLTHQEATQFVTDFFDEIADSLERNEPVKLMNFGKFDLIDKKARPGLNPKTGEPKLVEARRVVTFRPSNKLRQSVQRKAQDDPSDGS